MNDIIKSEGTNDCMGVTYEDFRGGSYFSFHNLTTDSANMCFTMPSVKSGNVRVEVEFDKPTTTSLMMIVFSVSK